MSIGENVEIFYFGKWNTEERGRESTTKEKGKRAKKKGEIARRKTEERNNRICAISRQLRAFVSSYVSIIAVFFEEFPDFTEYRFRTVVARGGGGGLSLSINPIRLHSNRDILHALAAISSEVERTLKTEGLSRRRFFSPRPSRRPELSISSLSLFLSSPSLSFALFLSPLAPCVCYFFHGPRSPQLENGTFERVNASVRDQRAQKQRGPGFTLLHQCFRNNVRSMCINFLPGWWTQTQGVL